MGMTRSIAFYFTEGTVEKELTRLFSGLGLG